ncbi:N5-glutamine methyltransferase, modifies release factors RF-1 and RF-2 [Rubrivivax sp. A210]|uniref:peptide chain release factor N(5)-glutamine methyltransferase n=1 Tax=Rubrivivax sp. A210 TaxID=2772301 RepID=UPI0019191A53|nr:peptide chain release factor N(5)-glutamine methyltransferase [Rubrivivax sp. A210]CAD5374157.1 N5-glutamine methyltransferase, modifies release factors RF-1 and RF-2 [Rubrivivax sp. A210]
MSASPESPDSPASPGLSIAKALVQARASGVARLDAQLLLAHLLQRNRAWLLAHDDAVLTPPQAVAWTALLARRAAGEPLAYLVGECEFRGLALKVSPAVLVPRPETELLVEWALERLPSAPAATVIDLGTGSGAVALAVKNAAPGAKVTATDASPTALAVAQANAERHALALTLSQGDWWSAVPGQRYGLALSNPPYIAAGDPHLAALVHEPATALTPGGDGLDALRRLIDGAPAHLQPGAWLLLEHGHDQHEAVQALLTACGFGQAETRRDLAGLARCTGAPWPGA